MPKAKIKPYLVSGKNPATVRAIQQVAQEFRVAMAESGISQADLAKKMRVGEDRVWQLLNGCPVSLTTIVAFFSACGKKFKIVAE
jgi:hypothetical protein